LPLSGALGFHSIWVQIKFLLFCNKSYLLETMSLIAFKLGNIKMKKVFRFLLLLLVAFALYAGFSSQEWSYPAGIIAFCFLCFLATLNGKRSSNSTQTSKSSSAVVLGASVTSNFSSGSDCGSSDGGC
jgi:hypothetical protein